MRQLVDAGELQHLVPERVWQEMQGALGTRQPQVFFAVLRECGALMVLLPELEALYGVPQPPSFHPEIDTGIHMMMVLEQAALLSQDTAVRYAALVHDLGKGTTPQEVWPSHTGHEERGAALIAAVSERLRVPNEYKELGMMVSLQHTRCHRALKHSAVDLFLTLERCDALRRPERFEQFLLACEADARGRKGLEQQPYPQADRLRRCLQAARSVDVAPLAARYQKQELGVKIREARIAALETLPDISSG
jgi:tRNA nucleotidyltransferase (CCA-adding enzyme)